ncbi:hypothetical protein SynBIOSU31_01730 [Synechococcus sp. BIOS-U3-1]|nr:hypothetical protein SynBIOSU31_01730 [Synechococcus sp. BIOS-U3-1]|tara:strand:- start:653 stop:817 length:165 start_codon:yes stop_codon:yes gene_type:complete
MKLRLIILIHKEAQDQTQSKICTGMRRLLDQDKNGHTPNQTNSRQPDWFAIIIQ